MMPTDNRDEDDIMSLGFADKVKNSKSPVRVDSPLRNTEVP